jgi:hypothetical protein
MSKEEKMEKDGSKITRSIIVYQKRRDAIRVDIAYRVSLIF